MSRRHKRMTLALAESDALPTEFRLFVPGWNDTENGRFLFDAKAAKAVMSAYKAWGVDLAIDLEHNMLEVEPGAPDATARDARGWCKLELRNGELWAVDVRWTPDGAERLQQKRQRYISPAFEIDPKTKRVTKMINVAITAMPATHDTPALVAARKGFSMNPEKLRKAVQLAATMGLDPSLVKQALDAVEQGDTEKAMEILKGLIVSAAGGDASADDDDDAGGEGDGADGVSPPAEENAEKPPQVESAAPPPPPNGDDADDDDDEDNPKKKTERKAMRRMLCRLAGKKTFAEAVAEAEVWRNSHLTLEIERKQLAAERATLESAERKRLAIELITLGAEFPATVWADAGEKKPSKLKDRWLKMPIAELRTHVAEQRAARGGKRTQAPRPPHGGQQTAGGPPQVVATSVTLDDGYVVELSADQVRIANSYGTDLKDYARGIVLRDGRK